MLSTNIKEATKTAHQQLEVKVIKKLKAIRSEAEYADFLKHFYAYFSHLERQILPYLNVEILPDYRDRRNSGYLKSDIEALGFTIEDLPSTTFPEISNVLEALAALYVMEGSIMGGSIIVQMLAKGGITKGISFFSGYGSETGQMWGKFIAVLNNAAKTTADEDLAIKTANATFIHFSEVFATVDVV